MFGLNAKHSYSFSASAVFISLTKTSNEMKSIIFCSNRRWLSLFNEFDHFGFSSLDFLCWRNLISPKAKNEMPRVESVYFFYRYEGIIESYLFDHSN